MGKKNLTNESLKKHFKGNYLLTNYAILLGREAVLSGQYVNLDTLLASVQKSVQNVTDDSEKEQLGIL